VSEIDRGDEHRLLDRFRAERDEASFRALYRAATPYLWAFARRLAALDDAEAEELVQETWVRAVERVGTFRGESAVRTWLGGVLVNCWRERRRGQWREVETLENGPIVAAEPLPERVPTIDLERALASLPDSLRVVVVLHDLEGLTHVEIAESLGVPAGTSKRRLFDARRELRRRLGGGSLGGAP